MNEAPLVTGGPFAMSGGGRAGLSCGPGAAMVGR